MNITFNRMTITNFKSHRSLVIDFGDITTINGTNGAGKSSIGEAISWTLYGTDPLGTKLDPTPIGDAAWLVDGLNTKAELLLTVDDKQLLLAREIAGGKNKFYVNEVPEKATKYSELVEALFDKDLFLSLFTPGFFFTQHWEKQRSQLLSYVAEPTNKEVLAQLSTVAQERLGEALLKKSLDDLDKMHRDNKNKTDKELQRLDGTLEAHERAAQEAQEAAHGIDPNVTIDQLYELANAYQSEIDGHSIKIREQQAYDRQLSQLEAKVQSTEQIAIQRKEAYMKAKETPNYAESCHSCGRPHTEETIEFNKQNWKEGIKLQFDGAKASIDAYKAADALLQEHKAKPRPEVPDITELHAYVNEANRSIMILQAVERTQATLAETRAKRKEVAKSNGASDSMIDWIKAFRAKRAEITANKVADLFTTLSIRLFNETKEGDQKPTFEIEMNGVPYSKLSTAEKIKAGLELNEVLSIQSGVVAPVFVDNAESILRFRKPVGQLIVALVQDSQLSITTENLETEGVAVNE